MTSLRTKNKFLQQLHHLFAQTVAPFQFTNTLKQASVSALSSVESCTSSLTYDKLQSTSSIQDSHLMITAALINRN